MFTTLLATSALGRPFDAENPIDRLEEELGRRRYFWGRGFDESDDSDDWKQFEDADWSQLEDDLEDEGVPISYTSPSLELDASDEDPAVIVEAVKDCDALKEEMEKAERRVQEWAQHEARNGRFVHESEKDARWLSFIADGWKAFTDSGWADTISDGIKNLGGRRRAGETKAEAEQELMTVVEGCKKLTEVMESDPEVAEVIEAAVEEEAEKEAEARRARNARELYDLIDQARAIGDRAERLLRAERSRY